MINSFEKKKTNKNLTNNSEISKNTINTHSMKKLWKTCKFQKLKTSNQLDPSNQRGSMGRRKDTYKGQE